MDGSDESLSVVLFSGTDDRLDAATVLVTGAAAMGRKVNVFLQWWGLRAFRADLINKDHGLSSEAGADGVDVVRDWGMRGGTQHWSETLRQAKDIGEVTITACALSMDMFGLMKDDLDPLVDGVEGVASFMAKTTGPVVFV